MHYVAIRIDSDDPKTTIDNIEELYNLVESDRPMDYFFLNSRLNENFGKEDTILNFIIYMAMLSILVSCIGLLAMSSNLINRRSKGICHSKGSRSIFIQHCSTFQYVFL